MELLSRYRNVSVLLLVIFAQLVLLAYQVKGNQDVRLIRVWAVTAVTPVAKVAESVRSSTVGVVEDYILFHNLRDENRRLKEELGRLKLDNAFLKSQLSTADRIKALSAFQERNPSRTVASRVIATGTGANTRVVFVDRGSRGGVMRGMAVITPDGIVGKVLAAYPTASQVLLITDPTFAAGVISQKHKVRGTVRGQGHGACIVDYIQNEEQVDAGENFFTSGDDGVFPEGLPVGRVTVVRPGAGGYKQIYLEPSGLQGGLEEVLIILEGAHQPIPELPQAASEVHLQPPPPGERAPAGTPAGAPAGAAASLMKTDADKLVERYRKIGEAEGHVFGTGLPGSKPPDFNLSPEAAAAKRAAQGTKPAAPAGAPKPGVAPPNPAAEAAKPPLANSSKPSAVAKPIPGEPGAAVPVAKPPAAPPPKPSVPKPVIPKPAVPSAKPQPGAGAAPATGRGPQAAGEPAKPAPQQP